MKIIFPPFKEIILVFSTIVALNFSWSICRMFWYVPSWQLFLDIRSILSVYAYVLSFALIESLLVLGLLLSISLLVPGKYFKDKFVAQGSVMVIMLTIATLVYHKYSSLTFTWSPLELKFYPFLILVTTVIFSLAYSYLLIRRFTKLEDFIMSLVYRISIFAYIYIPLGILGLVVVLTRNIF